MKKTTFSFLAILFFIGANAQLPNSDVWLFSFCVKSGNYIFKDGKNISNNPGYDNQPFFSADGKNMLWTSERDSGQTDVFSYYLNERSAVRKIQTPVSEYSPEFIPKDHFISCVVVEKDSAQRLWKYNMLSDSAGTRSSLVLPGVKDVAYSRWYNANTVFVCLLPEPMTLYMADTRTGKLDKCATNVGRSMQVYHRGKEKLFLYTKENPDSTFSIQAAGTPGNLSPNFKPVNCLPGSQDFIIDKKGNIFMAKGSKIFLWTIDKSIAWKEVADLSAQGIHSITRMALSPDGKNLALVDNIK